MGKTVFNFNKLKKKNENPSETKKNALYAKKWGFLSGYNIID